MYIKIYLDISNQDRRSTSRYTPRPGAGRSEPRDQWRFTMFHRWNMGHGGPAFAGGGPGPEAYWAARRAEQEQAPQGWQDWHGHGGHGHGGHGPWQGGPPWMRHGGPGFAPPWAWAPWALRRGFGGG